MKTIQTLKILPVNGVHEEHGLVARRRKFAIGLQGNVHQVAHTGALQNGMGRMGVDEFSAQMVYHVVLRYPDKNAKNRQFVYG